MLAPIFLLTKLLLNDRKGCPRPYLRIVICKGSNLIAPPCPSHALTWFWEVCRLSGHFEPGSTKLSR